MFKWLSCILGGDGSRRYRAGREEEPGVRPPPEIYSGKEGKPPSHVVALAPVASLDNIVAAGTGPGDGIMLMHRCVPDLKGFESQKMHDWAYGHSTSLYDSIPDSTAGAKAGDPIADTFALLSYDGLTLMVVADGVNWGEPAKRAARGAVLGAVGHVQRSLAGVISQGSGSHPTSESVFQMLLEALGPAQKLILSQAGTLTTLVMTVVARLATPGRWSSSDGKAEAGGGGAEGGNAAAGGGRGEGAGLLSPSSPTSAPSSSSQDSYQWAAMSITVGDSGAFVWRKRERVVQELTYASHAGAFRDPRWTPGALGYALGEDPDLTNLTCSLTVLSPGDLVFLASDGISDNFCPLVLKTATQAIPRFSEEEFPSEATVGGGGGGGGPTSSSSTNAADGVGSMPTMDAFQSHAAQMVNMSLAVNMMAAAAEAAASSHPSSSPTSPSSSSGAVSSLPMLTARSLVHGLLDWVMKVTEDQRTYAEGRTAAAKVGRSGSKSLETDTRGIASHLLTAPPGKLDHATVVAFLTPGGPRGSG